VAATAEAEQLTQSYRRQSAALKAAAIKDILAIWPMFDPLDLERSWPALRNALLLLIGSRRAEAANLAAEYLRRFRELEGAAGNLAVILDPVPAPVATAVSLQATGPATAQRAMDSGLAADAAAARALVTISGAAGRIILDGGRQTVLLTIESDREALGWMRVTHGKTCAFCAMLASRGPVYKSRRSAGDARSRPARFHDHCDCTVEPVYSTATTWPAASRRAEELWASSTVGLGGQEARNAFRAAWESTP
jgi:hypothetical protein